MEDATAEAKKRLKLAREEKQRTKGAALRNHTLGEDDISPVRKTDRRSTPRVHGVVESPSEHRIDGSPTRGRVGL